jgi:hypothetical protein
MGVTIPTFRRHLAEVEQRLGALEARTHALEELRDDLSALRKALGDRKYEVEELQEA